MRTHTGGKQTQQKKFTRLVEKSRKLECEENSEAKQIMERWVKNCSDHILSEVSVIIFILRISLKCVKIINNKSTRRVYDAERHFHLNECITVYMSELRKIQLNK